jgi:replicative DNA helicase
MATVKTSNAILSAKVPPQALDVERTVLGSMLIDINALDTGMVLLTEDCFYSTAHRNIFICIRDMCMHSTQVDIITLTEELKKREWLEVIGTEAYLSELVENVATSANIESHAKILQSKATLRNLISTAGDISTDCFSPDADAKHVLDKAESKIFQIADANIKHRPEKLRELLSTTFEDIEQYGKEGGITGVKTGYKKLDEMTAGFHPSDLVIIAARPSMGKTALCLNIAMNAAAYSDNKIPVIVFSLEMSKTQLVQRMLCSGGEIDIHRLRSGRLTKQERNKLGIAAGPLYKADIYIDDTPSINVMEIRAKCRRLKARGQLGMIIIDYIQLMGIVDKADNRQQEISQISRSLKGIAKELNIPVIALSQLSRAVEQRTGSHRPQLSDLRESGAIEQDSDVVLFIYREAMYIRNTKGIDSEEYKEARNTAEIIIGKQRNGPVGSVNLSFIDHYASFRDLDVIHVEEQPRF